VHDGGAIETRCRERLVERGRDVGGTHRGTEPPGHDVAREVVEHGREVVPTPAGDLEIGSLIDYLRSVSLSRISATCKVLRSHAIWRFISASKAPESRM
jgi:hypothetical protein